MEDEKELDTKDWPITENEKKKFWDEHILDKYIYPPKVCPVCIKGKLIIRDNTKNKILNPYLILSK